MLVTDIFEGGIEPFLCVSRTYAEYSKCCTNPIQLNRQESQVSFSRKQVRTYSYIGSGEGGLKTPELSHKSIFSRKIITTSN